MKKQSNFSRLMEYAGTHKYLTYASWILSAVSTLLALVPFIYIWKILEEIILSAPDYSKAVHISQYGVSAMLAAFASLFVYFAALMCSHTAAFHVAANLRITMMKHLTIVPIGEIDKLGSGKIRRIVHDASAATETYLAHRLPDKAGAIVTPIGILAMLLVFDWRLGLLSLIPGMLGFAVMMIQMTGKTLQKKMKEYQDALNDMSNEAVEYVRGVPVVKTFGQTIFSFKRFKTTIDKYSQWATDYTISLRRPMMLYTTAINGVFVVLIFAGIFFTRNTVDQTFLLNLIFYIVVTPIIALQLTRIMYQSEDEMIIADALEKMDIILNIKPQTAGKHGVHLQKYDIQLQDVSFSYDGEKNAINHISLSLHQGQTVAFVGPSGGGKSTLANLIARFCDPQEGQILIDGRDIAEISMDELMDTISFVFQNSRMIKGTLLDNVKMGKPDATREEIMDALSKAQCMDIIEKMPQGIDTVIGTNGVYLSGGEAQRMAIARAILKDAPILILDEATAYADPDNEVKVQMAINHLAKGKTVIMIAHRLSTIKNVDKIYVLKDGEIMEQGTFRQLLDREGIFAKMWNDYQTSAQWKMEKDKTKEEYTA